MQNESGILTFTASGAIGKNIRVKQTAASATVPPQVEIAGVGEQHIGVTTEAVLDAGLVAVKLRTCPGSMEMVASKAIAIATVVYGAAAGKVSDASSGSAIGMSKKAASGDGSIIEILPFNVQSTTAATTSIVDAGTFTAETDVEGALQEVYQDLRTTKRAVPLPMPVMTDAGVALAAFVNAADPLPGFCVTAEGLGIRWNNHATPTAVGVVVPIPTDFDPSVDAVLHIIAAKTGATLGDATKFTVTAYNNVVGALYDADANFGGDTDAMVGDATAKMVQEVTLTLALANLAASPAGLQLTLKPKDGTLGTDDVIMLASWIEYKKLVLTS